jgi:hypothetical protein
VKTLPFEVTAPNLTQTTNFASFARVASINDGSPDCDAVKAFNTLTGENVSNPVFWENIGTKITFWANGGPSPQLVLQPYPTYYEFRNGRLVNTYPQASTPRANFYSAGIN